MSKDEKANILDCLYSEKDWKLVNVKFSRGSRADVIRGAEFCTQMHEVSLQKKLGTIEPTMNPPKAAHPKVDVREFVAKL